MVCRALVLAIVGFAGLVTLGSTEGHSETEVQIRLFRPTQHIGRGGGGTGGADTVQKPKVKALANVKRRPRTKVRLLR